MSQTLLQQDVNVESAEELLGSTMIVAENGHHLYAQSDFDLELRPLDFSSYQTT
jgi:hypothetical protein